MSRLESAWLDVISGRNGTPLGHAARAGLSALSWGYGLVVGVRGAVYDLGLAPRRRLGCPVIGVGNLTVGGTGKTTMTAWLLERLLEFGRRPAALCHGYGAAARPRSARRLPLVVSDGSRILVPVQESGDEPQMLARRFPQVPIVCGRRRFDGGRLAVSELKADVLVLDDAFQYRRLRKDLDILLVNATNPFGYSRLFPRGMLRESPVAIRRADLAVVTHSGSVDEGAREAIRRRLRRFNPAIEIVEAVHRVGGFRAAGRDPDVVRVPVLPGNWFAFSSLGDKEGFLRSLHECGVALSGEITFPDHHPYAREDLADLCDRVRRAGADGLVTTAKDAVKVAPDWLQEVPLQVMEVEMSFVVGESVLRSRLAEVVTARGAG